MSEMYDEKPKKEKRDEVQGANPIIVAVAIILIIILLVAGSVAVFLSMMSPSIGNIFSNIIQTLATPVQ